MYTILTLKTAVRHEKARRRILPCTTLIWLGAGSLSDTSLSELDHEQPRPPKLTEGRSFTWSPNEASPSLDSWLRPILFVCFWSLACFCLLLGWGPAIIGGLCFGEGGGGVTILGDWTTGSANGRAAWRVCGCPGRPSVMAALRTARRLVRWGEDWRTGERERSAWRHLSWEKTNWRRGGCRYDYCYCNSTSDEVHL